jgi:hypothetical protein
MRLQAGYASQQSNLSLTCFFCLPQVAPAPLPTKHADGSSPGPYLPGILKEGLISVGSKKAEEPDPLEPEIIKRLDNRYR